MNITTRIAGGAAAVLVAAGLLTAKWEGTRLNAYQDHIGVWTICTGHTGPEVVRGLRATKAQCDEWHRKDLNIAYDTTIRCVPGNIPNSVRAAYTSFALNVGPGGKGRKDGMCVLKSGAVPTHVKLLNSGQYIKACDQLLKWSNAGGQFSRGIYNRRVSEMTLCKEDL